MQKDASESVFSKFRILEQVIEFDYSFPLVYIPSPEVIRFSFVGKNSRILRWSR